MWHRIPSLIYHRGIAEVIIVCIKWLPKEETACDRDRSMHYHISTKQAYNKNKFNHFLCNRNLLSLIKIHVLWNITLVYW